MLWAEHAFQGTEQKQDCSNLCWDCLKVWFHVILDLVSLWIASYPFLFRSGWLRNVFHAGCASCLCSQSDVLRILSFYRKVWKHSLSFAIYYNKNLRTSHHLKIQRFCYLNLNFTTSLLANKYLWCGVPFLRGAPKIHRCSWLKGMTKARGSAKAYKVSLGYTLAVKISLFPSISNSSGFWIKGWSEKEDREIG